MFIFIFNHLFFFSSIKFVGTYLVESLIGIVSLVVLLLDYLFLFLSYFFYCNRLYAYVIIYYANPFFIKNIFFCVYGTICTFYPYKNNTAVPINFYLCYNSYNYFFNFYCFTFSYCYFLACVLPISSYYY